MEQVIATIDKAIGYYMVDHNLTREQMAKQLGISRNTLQWKREGKNEWLLSEIVALSDLMGKSLDELTGFEPATD